MNRGDSMLRPLILSLIVSVLLALAPVAGTPGPTAHPTDAQAASHSGWWHRLQHWVIGALGGVHPHPADEDGQPDAVAPVVFTRFTDHTELFVEFPPLVVGRPSEFLVHLTRLADFQPVTEGTVTVRLQDAGDPAKVFRTDAPSRPGLFRVSVTPRSAGSRGLVIRFDSPELTDEHVLGDVTVYPDVAAARADRVAASEDDGDVVFLKEQQWRSGLATESVRVRRLLGSVPATATLRATADGEVHVTAPSAGHLAAADAGFPYTGMEVEQGQVLAYLAPLLGGETDVAGLELAVKRAASAYELASQERKRLEALLDQGAVPRRRVLEARSEEAVGRAELEAARKRLAQVTRSPDSEASGVAVRAPIAGTVAYVNVAPGGYVEQGDRLFHLINRDRLWLEARLAEVDVGRIRQPTGAWFTAEGFDRTFEIGAVGESRLVAFGGMVDPQSRTLPVVFEFPNPDDALRVGMFVRARIYTGEQQEAPAVPTGALVNDAGTEVVYVQRSGERFERRPVRTGLRDGDYVAVLEGLVPGERVVARGAYLVHLAAGAPAAAGHDHGH